MKNKYIEILEEILEYLETNNKVLYDKLNDMMIEIYSNKEKRNKYVRDKINEKRKTNKEYAGNKRKSKKVVD